MKRLMIFSIFGFFAFANPAKALSFTDPAVLAAILHQTATQTAEHLSRLAQAIQTVQTLQQQLSSTQNILQLAQYNAQGVDGSQIIANFENTILSANSVIQAIQSDINTS